VGNLAAKVNIGVVRTGVFGCPLPYWPSDGVLGFQRLYLGDASVESTVFDLARAAGAPQVTLFGGDFAKGRPGVLTFGGPDATNCASAWNSVSQGPGIIFEWDLQINGFQFGAYKEPIPQWNGILGTDAKTSVPQKVFDQIVKTLAAEFDFASDEYLVNCDAAKSAPEIVIQLSPFSGSISPSAHEYRIPSTAFAANLTNRTDGKCILLFEQTYQDSFYDWKMGWNALAGYCWMFDYGAKEFAFAKAKQ
ncbi:aspartic protease, partial [Aphelenchoides avenae]